LDKIRGFSFFFFKNAIFFFSKFFKEALSFFLKELNASLKNFILFLFLFQFLNWNKNSLKNSPFFSFFTNFYEFEVQKKL
jgi:hypothetical protein